MNLKKNIRQLLLNIKVRMCRVRTDAELYDVLKKNMYTSLHDMPFSNWLDMKKGNLSAMKRLDMFILDDMLMYNEYLLWCEEKDLFGLSKDEVLYHKQRAKITILENRFVNTGNFLHKDQADRVRAQMSSVDSKELNDYKLGDYAEFIFSNTKQTYNLAVMSAFEVLTIIKSVSNGVK